MLGPESGRYKKHGVPVACSSIRDKQAGTVARAPGWAVGLRTPIQALCLTCDPRRVPSLDHSSYLQKHSLTSVLSGWLLTLKKILKALGQDNPETANSQACKGQVGNRENW